MDNASHIESGDTGAVLGNTATVCFTSFGNRTVEGKVDTGATTSSLHAEKITVNEQRQTVTFYSDAISPNMITLPIKGVQEVHSADHGGAHRPTVELDVSIDSTPITGALFNLNDRSNMDAKVLIGQNILKSGNFTIDPNKGAESQQAQRNEAEIIEALQVLAESNITLSQLLQYLRTAAVNRIDTLPL